MQIINIVSSVSAPGAKIIAARSVFNAPNSKPVYGSPYGFVYKEGTLKYFSEDKINTILLFYFPTFKEALKFILSY